MTFGVKTNERPGTRAVVRHVRMSASKARVVLDLVRGLPVGEAADVLRFTERAAAEVIGKGLDSAVANAAHNDGLDPELLYISACFADEGKTMKRFRPRARGRASRINKRMCHITIIVSPMPAAMVERFRAKQEAIPGSRAARRRGQQTAQDRAARVARSKGGDSATADETTSDHIVADEVVSDDVTTDETTTDEAVSDEAVETTDDAVEAEEAETSTETESAETEPADADESAEDGEK